VLSEGAPGVSGVGLISSGIGLVSSGVGLVSWGVGLVSSESVLSGEVGTSTRGPASGEGGPPLGVASGDPSELPSTGASLGGDTSGLPDAVSDSASEGCSYNPVLGEVGGDSAMDVGASGDDGEILGVGDGVLRGSEGLAAGETGVACMLAEARVPGKGATRSKSGSTL
jgi:hypothetical protein